MRIGLLLSPRARADRPAVRAIADGLESAGHDTWSAAVESIADQTSRMERSDLLVSLGGDGAMLRVGLAAAAVEVPCMGINFGRLGFLTEFEAHDFVGRIQDLDFAAGWIERRLLLDWAQVRDGQVIDRGSALNDIVAARGQVARLVDVLVHIDGVAVLGYRADGILVATPTGTTAYSLALQSSIVHPAAEVISISPICPFRNSANGLVVDAGAKIEIKLSGFSEAALTIDGTNLHKLRDGDVVSCRRSARTVHFLRFGPADYFYRDLADRLQLSPPPRS